MEFHPPAVWIGFSVLVLGLLVLDLGVLNRKSHVLSFREALSWSAGLVALALLFGVFLWAREGTRAALEYYTGYVIELSLSVDNLFVFLLIFQYFAVPAELQPRILKWGILGALVMRAIMIGLGALLLQQFTWIIYLFGGILILTGVRMFRGTGDRIEPERNPLVRLTRRFVPMADAYDGQKFTTRSIQGRWMVTPLMLVLLVVEWSDLVFAIDSIPAIFAITRDPFIVYSSNVFAILGLRALFFVLAGMMDRFEYLKPGVAAILVFVGMKMVLNGLLHVPIGISLGVIVGILGGSVVLSIRKTPGVGERVVRALFEGTTVLVTGASGGIGAAFAELLAPTGARLLLTARRPDRLDAVAGRARAMGASVDVLRLDLMAPGAVASLVQDLAAQGMTIDHLVNNAGIGLAGRGHESPVDAQLRVVDLNVRAATELALRLLPGMVARSRGGLLNVASLAAFQGLPWLSTYSGSKAYLLGWSEALHVELRGTGVRCTCLCPGPVDTGWFAAAHLDTPPSRALMQSARAVARAGLRGYALNRSHVMSGPIARAAAWLTRAAPRALAARVATGFAKPRTPR